MERNLTAKKSCIKKQVVAKSLSIGVQEGRVFLLYTTAGQPKDLNYCCQAQNKSKTVVFASYERHLDNVTTFHMFSTLRIMRQALSSVISFITLQNVVLDCMYLVQECTPKIYIIHKKACVGIPEQSNWNNITDLLCLLHDCP